MLLYPGGSIGLKFIPSQSELSRFIPISVSNPMWIIPNQSEECLVSRLMKKGPKSIQLNPINSETSIRMNPNQSETKFSIQINPSSDWSKPSFQSESVRMNPRSELFGLIQIDSDWKLGLDQSELGFWTNPKNVLYLVWWKIVKNQSDSIRFIPRHQSEWIQTNPKPSCQSEFGLIQTEFSIRINLNQSVSFRPRIHSDWFWLKTRFRSIRPRTYSDWKLGFGLVQIHSDSFLGLSRIDFLPFLIKRDIKRFSD